MLRIESGTPWLSVRHGLNSNTDIGNCKNHFLGFGGLMSRRHPSTFQCTHSRMGNTAMTNSMFILPFRAHGRDSDIDLFFIGHTIYSDPDVLDYVTTYATIIIIAYLRGREGKYPKMASSDDFESISGSENSEEIVNASFFDELLNRLSPQLLKKNSNIRDAIVAYNVLNCVRRTAKSRQVCTGLLTTAAGHGLKPGMVWFVACEGTHKHEWLFLSPAPCRTWRTTKSRIV
uniref:Uncharacterized protein n=1 Tax=Timema bartmani TaxID=61472 RepID=A0A7R9I6N9_9NEOP|nr:unnamed protein product [Timema bartmani]